MPAQGGLSGRHAAWADTVHPHLRRQFVGQLANQPGGRVLAGGIQRPAAAGIPRGVRQGKDDAAFAGD